MLFYYQNSVKNLIKFINYFLLIALIILMLTFYNIQIKFPFMIEEINNKMSLLANLLKMYHITDILALNGSKISILCYQLLSILNIMMLEVLVSQFIRLNMVLMKILHIFLKLIPVQMEINL